MGQRTDVLKGFRTLFATGSISGLTDAELLERSADRGGATAEVAFAALVERHGPMVLRVCRKALGDPHDAHDAFQSTFLVLARKGDSIRDKRSVASWLHGVALRVSAASRAAEMRRRKHERRKADGFVSMIPAETPDDLGAVLHEEVGRLPGRYRDAVVLCYFEGRSYEEAAGHLRLPVGTIKSRLSWARDRLRDRLVLRGLAPAAGAVATMLAAESAYAAVAVPSSWVEGTASLAMAFASAGSGTVPGTASALANGVIQAMFMSKFKIATAALAGLLITGAALMAQQPAPRGGGDNEPERDRLRAMEAKLDRLISAMERANERVMPPPVVAADGRYERRIEATPRFTPPAQELPAGAIAPRPAVRSRREGGSIEERLARLEARMDRLERRLEGGPMGPGPGGPGMRPGGAPPLGPHSSSPVAAPPGAPSIIPGAAPPAAPAPPGGPVAPVAPVPAGLPGAPSGAVETLPSPTPTLVPDGSGAAPAVVPVTPAPSSVGL